MMATQQPGPWLTWEPWPGSFGLEGPGVWPPHPTMGVPRGSEYSRVRE